MQVSEAVLGLPMFHILATLPGYVEQGCVYYVQWWLVL
jgi:hypothetical protein